MMYLLDANVFIESHKVHYNMKVFPCFWDKLVELAKQGVVFTLDKVQRELMAGGDEVSNWFKTFFPAESILPTDEHTYASYQKVLNDVKGLNRYKSFALEAFADPDIADPFLCAYAMSHLGFSVVTYERSHPDRITKVILPDICALEGVGCSRLIPVLLDLGIVFK